MCSTRSASQRCLIPQSVLFALLLLVNASLPVHAAERALHGAAVENVCRVHTSVSQCSTHPLLVSGLPAPVSRPERLLVHFAALSYSCSQHTAEPDCAKDTKNSCTWRKASNQCTMSSAAIVQHSAPALLCDGSQAKQAFMCALAKDCAATSGCVLDTEKQCIPKFQDAMEEEDAIHWANAFHQGKSSVWGSCLGGVVFKSLMGPCANQKQGPCRKNPMCSWAEGEAGRGAICGPTPRRMEAALVSHKEGLLQQQYLQALKLCRNKKPQDCMKGKETFTPNPAAVLKFSDLATVLAAPATQITNPRRTNSTGASPRHRHKHPHRHHTTPAPKTPTKQTPPASATPKAAQQQQPPAAPAPQTTPPPRPRAAEDAPSSVSMAMLALGCLVAIAVVVAAGFLAYRRMNPKVQYHPVLEDVMEPPSGPRAPAVQMTAGPPPQRD